jgi:uncharacterized protein with von Willebrand factor type A (vWA) domain
MNSYRYTKWTGQSPFVLDRDKLIDEFTRRLLSDGDVSGVLWDMQKTPFSDSYPHRLPSLDELLNRIQHQKQVYLGRYKLDSVMDDIRQALEDIIQAERDGIIRILQETRQKARDQSGELPDEIRQKLLKSLEKKAARHCQKLNSLPPDIGGRVKELSQYDFMDDEARRKFKELIQLLKKRALDTYAHELGQHISNMSPAAMAKIRQMVTDLNRILEQSIRGRGPDFENFIHRYGRFFGQDIPRNLEELVERLQNQIAQAESLLNSLSKEQKLSLENALNAMLDQKTRYELARLNANLKYLNQGIGFEEEYPFFGDESITYSEALKLMETLQKMDRLEDQIRESRFQHSLDNIDREMVRELLGDESADNLENIRNITKILEESGYIRRVNQTFELTSQGIRKIGEKALNAVFNRLKKDRTGEHRTLLQGGGGERLFETRKYEFGDDFDIHLEKTIMNALRRRPQTPVRLAVDDFEIFQEEQAARTATVLLLDLSLSMHMHGNFQAAKIVAIALDTLISSRYPRDRLYVVGFSSYARQMTREDLNHVNWDNLDPYTNMQHGLSLSRKLLSKEFNANKQIILITDGEPTAHFEDARVFFQYPPSLRTIRLTLKEVSKCARSKIIINAFKLKSGSFPDAFMDQMARLNRGRVFSTTAAKLGEYIIVDYLSGKKKKRIT